MNRLGHLRVINHHRHLVFKVCKKIGIFYQGLTHDLSKYSRVEFYNGAKYFEGFRSPTEKEREDKGYSEAWMHHKGRNKHHFEYWYDLMKSSGKYEPVEMPIRYIKEMFADRIAASKTYLKDKYTDAYPYEYLMTHVARDLMHPKTFEIISSWLLMLKEKGEKETFKYLKGIKNK